MAQFGAFRLYFTYIITYYHTSEQRNIQNCTKHRIEQHNFQPLGKKHLRRYLWKPQPLPSRCKTKYIFESEKLSNPIIINYYQHSKVTSKRSKSLTGHPTFRRQNTSDYFVPKRWKHIVAFIAALAFSQLRSRCQLRGSVSVLQDQHSFPFPLHNLSSFKENTNTDFRSTDKSINHDRKTEIFEVYLWEFFFLDHWICHPLYFNHRLNNDVSSAVDLFPQNSSLFSCTCKYTEPFDS